MFYLVIAFAYEQFSFLFTLKKSLSTERRLICPRWNRKFVHYSGYFTKKGITDHQMLRNSFINTLATEFWSHAFNDTKFEASEHDDSCRTDLWNSNQWNDHISRR